MLRIFAPLRINYGLVSTSLIITTSAISTSIIAINYDLYSALKQLLKPVIDKIKSAIEYLELEEGLLKLHEQVEKAFQSLKKLDLLSGLKTLFDKLKDWINYLSEKLPEWFQLENFLTFLDWLYVVIKSITDIFYEIEWKKLWGLIFTKEFWELTDSLGWIVSKTGGLENWRAEDFKEILDPVLKSKDKKEMQEEAKKLSERAKKVLEDIKTDSTKSQESNQQSQLAKQRLKKETPFIQELITKVLKITVIGISGNDEQEKNKNNIEVIAKGVDNIFWSLGGSIFSKIFKEKTE